MCGCMQELPKKAEEPSPEVYVSYDQTAESSIWTPLPLPEDATFEAGMHIARLWPQDDGTWEWYIAKIGLRARDGPWVIFLSDGYEVKQVCLVVHLTANCY